MALQVPVAGATITQYFDGHNSLEPARYFQNWSGQPLACFTTKFPGEGGYSAHYHGAIDYAAANGTPIVASDACQVIQFGSDPYSGNAKYVFARLNATTIIENWHLSGFRSGLAVGQIIPKGGVLGYVGMTGWATGPHDHFTLRITERDSDGVTRDYWYNPLLFETGGTLANDKRIISAYTSAPVPVPSSQYVELNGAGINIRTGPGTNYPIYRTSTSTYLIGLKMKFGGYVTGGGYLLNGVWQTQWAKIYLNAAFRYVAKPLIHFV